jgi:hypothetical protein
MQGVIVRTVTSEGRSETSSVSPKNSPFGQQGNPQVAAMDALAQDLDLSLGDDEELVAVLAFDDQLVAQRNLFRLEAAGHAAEDLIGQLGKQRHAAQRLRRKTRRSPPEIHFDPFGLASTPPWCD